VETQVDSRRQPGRGQHVAVVDEQHVLVDRHPRKQAAQLGGVLPVRGGAPAVEEDCRSYCGSSSSVLCAGADDDDDTAAASRAPLPFDLNMPPPQDATAAAAEADQMSCRYDTLLRL
jgi:EREBP-like factor